MFELGIEGPVARLRLDREEARNAIPLAGWAELGAKVREAERSGSHALIVAGSPVAFCAGADLADFPTLMEDPRAVSSFRREMREALDAVRGLEIPTLACVEGPCFGAGVALAMACDIRIAAEGARFAITPAKFGISYPPEDVARLVSLVGPGHASRLLFAAAPIDALEAQRIGLVELLVPDAPAAAAELAAAMAANSRESLATLKRAIRLAGEGRSVDEEHDSRFDALFGGAELKARLAALRRAR
jgi:enoyl-CoA hydratase/carnithine racemase